MIAGESQHLEMLRVSLYDLASYEQKNVLYTVIRLITERDPSVTQKSGFVGGLAALIDALVTEKTHLLEALVDWLTGNYTNRFNIGIHSRRAVLAALSPHPGKWSHLSISKHCSTEYRSRQNSIAKAAP